MKHGGLGLSLYIYSRIFENQPYEICSQLSEKASKGRFPSLKPKKLKNHCKERKGKEKKKERGENCIFSFYNSYFGDTLEKNFCCTQKVLTIWR